MVMSAEEQRDFWDAADKAAVAVAEWPQWKRNAAYTMSMTTEKFCNECKQPLLPRNFTIADGCPCNSFRGINHGIVEKDICTCDKCDPKKTGASRKRP